MIDDHRVVVHEAGGAPARKRRLWEWLDEEILPRLERPGRLLGPFEPSRAQAANRLEASPFVLLWPSLAEDLHVPVPLQRLKTASADRPTDFEIACAPPADLEQELQERGLPLFSRPSWRPLHESAVWVFWLESPLQVFGVLSILESAGVPTRRHERGDEAPWMVAAGPGAVACAPLLGVWVDAVLAETSLPTLGAWLASPLHLPETAIELRAALETAGLRPLESPDVEPPAASPVALPSPAGPSREAAADSEVAHRPVWRDDLAPPWVRPSPRRRGSVHESLWVGAGSERLRDSLRLARGDELAAPLERIFSLDAGSVTLVFALGLPGETPEDRLSIVEFVEQVLAVAPRQVRQVAIRLDAYCPGPEELARGVLPPTPAEFRAWVEALRAQISRKKLRIDSAPGGLPRIACLFGTGGAMLAPVVEQVHRAGARTAESVLATDLDLWHKSMELGEFRLPWEEPTPPVTTETVNIEPAPTGLPNLKPKLPSHAVAAPSRDSEGSSDSARRQGRGGRRRGAKPPEQSPSDRRRERWQRWKALAPRQFDYRVEFAKTGTLRFLSHGEIAELFLLACERAGLPLATAGVVQPRPKLRFGPSLPVGIEGAREYVDLGFARKVDDLGRKLREDLPDGLMVRTTRFVPSPPPPLALSQVTLAVYEARLASSYWKSAGALAELADRVARSPEWLAAGDQESGAHSFQQVRDIRLEMETDDQPSLHFSLDLQDPGSKCKPRDLLDRLVGDLVVDVRCIPLRRTHLLSVEEENGRNRLCTPMDQVVAHCRRMRAKAKHCA